MKVFMTGTPDKDLTLLKVLPVVLLVGLGLTGGGVWFAAFQVELALHGATTTGTVAGLEAGSSTSSSGRPGFFPMVEFVMSSGEVTTFRHRTGQNPPAYTVGQKVPVIYLPNEASPSGFTCHVRCVE
jgi:hypothetical protein